MTLCRNNIPTESTKKTDNQLKTPLCNVSDIQQQLCDYKQDVRKEQKLNKIKKLGIFTHLVKNRHFMNE